MVKIDLPNASQVRAGMAESSSSSSIVYALIEKTGVLIPLFIISWLVLAIKYYNRLIFTKPHRPNMMIPDGALPLIGHTYVFVKNGTTKQFERMREWVMSEQNLKKKRDTNADGLVSLCVCVFDICKLICFSLGHRISKQCGSLYNHGTRFCDSLE